MLMDKLLPKRTSPEDAEYCKSWPINSTLGCVPFPPGDYYPFSVMDPPSHLFFQLLLSGGNIQTGTRKLQNADEARLSGVAKTQKGK